MRPLQLLSQQLCVYEKALKKSEESFKNGDIDRETHLNHVINLKPKIEDYKFSIKILEHYTNTE